MSRSLTANMVTQMTGTSLTPVFLLNAAFDSGNLNLWSGIGNLTWNGDTYIGAGNMIGMGDVQETNQLQAVNVTFQLNGINSGVISDALNENYQGRPMYCWIACLDSNGNIFSDPYLLFQGLMDVLAITESGDTSNLAMSCESRNVDIQRVKEIDYTSQAQRGLYAGDTGCDFVAQLQDQPIYWGTATPTTS